MINNFPYKLIKGELHWLDAQSKTGWVNEKEIRELKPATCITRGWIFEETKDYIKTFATYSIDSEGIIEFGEILVIPKNWIIK